MSNKVQNPAQYLTNVFRQMKNPLNNEEKENHSSHGILSDFVRNNPPYPRKKSLLATHIDLSNIQHEEAEEIIHRRDGHKRGRGGHSR